ncbi:MAG: amidohydrolase family protein [Acidimicrobiia bacterium]|nr:amidohydrolase family protein [Acidimicrobiia bacterium]
MSIDLHAHCVPNGLIDLLRSDGGSFGIEVAEDGKGVTALFDGRRRVGPVRADLIDTSLRLKTMDDTGVDVQVLSSWVDLTGYELEPEAGATFARRSNEVMAEEVAAHPDRFEMLATVPLQHGELAAAELEYAVSELGAVGVEMCTTIDGAALADSDLEAFWAKAEELRCIVLLHPHMPLIGIDLSAKMLHNMVGRPLESTIAIGRLMVDGLFDRYPDLTMCMVHGGGALPYQVGRIQRGFEGIPHVVATDMKSTPLEVVAKLYFDTVVFTPASLRFLIDFAGADHVVLGSDYPFPMGDLDPITTLDTVPDLTADERTAILDDNAKRLISQVRRTG